MAGGKETPRQKMIGMMYLVLLAMLAMNVSKQIINAFVTLNNKLETSETAIQQKNSSAYAIFDGKMALPENKAIVEPWMNRAHSVKDLADRTADYLVTECSDMINEAEQKGDWYYIDEVTGRKELKPLADIEGKDKYDEPTRLFVGSDPSHPVQKGVNLFNRLHNYRDSVCYIMANYTQGKKSYSFTPTFDGTSLVEFDEEGNITSYADLTAALATANPEDTTKILNVYKMLSMPTELKNHDEMYTWQAAMFDHSPIVAAAAMFTAWKVDVRTAESQAADFFLSKVDVPVFNFNKIEPLAFASTGYINQGDSLNLRVMIAAYDSTENPIIQYGLDADTANRDAWKTVNGGIGLKGDQAGPHKAKGVIMVKQKGELVPKPWEFNYTVGQPMGVVSLPDMNVLYKGYDNKVMGTASGFPADKISLSGSGCTISKSGNFYIARPGSGSTAKISVMGKKDDGTSVNLGTFEFRVKNLPPPSIYLGSIVDGSTVSKSNLKAQTRLFAKYGPEIPLNVSFSVVSWSMSVTGAPREVKGTGSALNSQAKAMIKGVQPGGMVSFMVQVKGPDGIARKKSGTFKAG